MIELTNPNRQFIDGSWYDEEYRRKWYRRQYIDTPEPDWAKEHKDYYTALMIAYTGARPSWRVLDVGCGVGQVIEAWGRHGYRKVRGIEISSVAVAHTWGKSFDLYQRIVAGSAADMHMFPDGHFDLVSSFAFLEHVDESILPAVLSEFARLAPRQAHTIATDAGTDPSHINIKTPAGWMDALGKSLEAQPSLVAALPDPLMGESPVYVVLPKDGIPRPVRDGFERGRKAG